MVIYGPSGLPAAARGFVDTGRPVDTQARTGIEELNLKLERMQLALQTLLMLLMEKKVIQEQEFREWLAYVDQLDGAADGRLREDKSPRICPKCNRPTPRAIPRCVYCSAELEPEILQRLPPAPPAP